MNLARVTGKVWATRKNSALENMALLILQPLDGNGQDSGEMLAAVDPLGCVLHQEVFFVSSKEAALPASRNAAGR